MRLKSMLRALAISLAGIALVFTIVSVWAIGNLSKSLQATTLDAQQYANAINVSRQAQVNFQRQVQEWKDVLIRGNEPERYDKHWRGFVVREQEVQEGLAELRQLFVVLGKNVDQIDKLLAEHKRLGDSYRKALSGFDARDRESGKKIDREIRGVDRPASEAMDKLAAEIEKDADTKLLMAKSDAESTSQASYFAFGVVAALSLLITVILSWRIGSGVLNIVGAEPADLVHSFSFIAHGDLSKGIPLRDNDESSLAAHARLMQLRVRAMVVAIKQGVSEFMNAADRADAAETAYEANASLREAKKAMLALGRSADRFKV